MKNFLILTPVYNDWENLNKLLKNINNHAEENNFEFEILVINDCSKLNIKIDFKKTKNIVSLDILNLSKNIGSQRAIAIGLEYLFDNKKNNNLTDIIIIDSDGQDSHEILKNLIDYNKKFQTDITVVERTNRNEPFWFQFFYFLHKKVLLFFTGKHIKFGNFSLIKFIKLQKIVKKSDLWAAYPAAVIKNINKIGKIKSERMNRYSGKTKMNLKKLFFHSSRVFSVFKVKIFFVSLIYASLITLLFKNNVEYIYFILTIIFTANVYNFYISFLNKQDFKKKKESIKFKIEKIF
tara:strand:- start:1717 stop:2595 length:879 start_codon:yes stop_codon:yes gene_type:complete